MAFTWNLEVLGLRGGAILGWVDRIRVYGLESELELGLELVRVGLGVGGIEERRETFDVEELADRLGKGLGKATAPDGCEKWNDEKTGYGWDWWRLRAYNTIPYNTTQYGYGRRLRLREAGSGSKDAYYLLTVYSLAFQDAREKDSGIESNQNRCGTWNWELGNWGFRDLEFEEMHVDAGPEAEALLS
ncbi:hypothetical protein GALMADRAFT_205275 [Galerina marginata CBS 339.88]|uniref:Uncharacterized protein n=1 Tax=Galerina marginata (strain CBS 339.88) TaxID=685588 RepID=A0A067U3Q0_GALM3|nr:hypothetical protein GALMADRAFT_205275 [Galerina marginata CBS 339.88]